MRRHDLQRLQPFLGLFDLQTRLAILDRQESALDTREVVADLQHFLGVQLAIAGQPLIDFRLDAVVARKNLRVVEAELARRFQIALRQTRVAPEVRTRSDRRGIRLEQFVRCRRAILVAGEQQVLEIGGVEANDHIAPAQQRSIVSHPRHLQRRRRILRRRDGRRLHRLQRPLRPHAPHECRRLDGERRDVVGFAAGEDENQNADRRSRIAVANPRVGGPAICDLRSAILGQQRCHPER